MHDNAAWHTFSNALAEFTLLLCDFSAHDTSCSNVNDTKDSKSLLFVNFLHLSIITIMIFPHANHVNAGYFRPLTTHSSARHSF